MIIALAGRRIDEKNADYVRFPLSNLQLVKERVKETLISIKCEAIVCAGACGSDLIALEVAGDIGVRRTMVLPYSHIEFRKNSVTDRPGNWGESFDTIYSQLLSSGNVRILEYDPDEPDVFKKANINILNEAMSLSTRDNDVVAIIVWEGVSRGENDITELFHKEAKSMNLETVEILTR